MEGWEGHPTPRLTSEAVDATPTSRPGVPREWSPEPAPGAYWTVPEAQPDAAALEASGVRRRTPVFGTAQPARGASGALRRLAYRLPDQRAARWALLLAADRVDVAEHRLARGLGILALLGAVAAGYALASRALRR
ncbi:hypothetical protein [Anaeromyxobacter oryzisoli]|uniref:hypothetical protein n=1 Tax=Anaeromyxobacter oryzisoli TaxID=2925408 RepID=UPI001F5AA9AD|nr:hypothetical protein [Anaeromyxobacter sp. SG63]